MKRFRSSYTSLHHLRQQEARLSEMELGVRLSILRAAQERRDEVDASIAAASRAVLTAGTGSGLAADWLAHQQYIGFLEGTAALAAQQVSEAQTAVEAAQADVAQKRAGVEVIQKLLDRDRAVYRREILQQQQHQSDEFGIRRIFRAAEVAGGTES